MNRMGIRLVALVLLICMVLALAGWSTPEETVGLLTKTGTLSNTSVFLSKIKESINSKKTTKELGDLTKEYQADGFKIWIREDMELTSQTQIQGDIKITALLWDGGDRVITIAPTKFDLEIELTSEIAALSLSEMGNTFRASGAEVTEEGIEEMTVAGSSAYSQKLTAKIGNETMHIHTIVFLKDSYLFVGASLSPKESFDATDKLFVSILNSIEME